MTNTHSVCHSILVLKDGQVVESGNFRDLIAYGGIFAAMWEDQVSAEEAAEIVNKSYTPPRQRVTGYVVNEPESQILQEAAEQAQPPEPQLVVANDPPAEVEDPFADPFPAIPDRASTIIDQVTTDSPLPSSVPLPEGTVVDVPAVERPVEELALDNGSVTAKPDPSEVVPDSTEETQIPPAVAFPSSTPEGEADVTEIIDVSSTVPILSPKPQVSPGPVTFPSGDPEVTQSAPATPAPVAFPGGAITAAHQHQSVTFSSGIATPPRSGTPDPDSKIPKRIRKTSQNIQKFARSLSFVSKRQSTVGSSVTKVEGLNSAPGTAGPGTPRSSREDSLVTRGIGSNGEGSIGGDSGSSLGPDRDDKDKDKESKKSRKLKSRKSTK